MTFVVSVCFCFVILLLYGAAPAILVEIVAVGTAARRLHLNLRSWAYLTARLVCSFAVAGAVAEALYESAAEVRGPFGLVGVEDLALIALTFVAVSCVINLAGAVLARATREEIMAQLRFEVFARGSVVVLGVVIATTPSAWSLVLLFVPVLGWSQLSRVLADQDRRLEHDPVTGLLSQHGLAMEVTNMPREYDRENDWFGVILVQLRGLAYVSRNVGRDAAEHVMRVVAKRLRDGGRPGDRIARLSESQFVVLRTDFWNESALDGARGVVRALSEPVESQEGIPFRVDPVAGVALAPQDGHDLGRLVPHAEAAVFDATAHGKVAAVYRPESPSDVDGRLSVLRRLSVAVTDPAHAAEIAVLFQPQVSIATGRTDSVEALLRWHDPEGGLMPTDQLMRIVEPTGVMQQLTRHVLDRVLAQLAEWNSTGLHLRAAVNVSVLDLSGEGFDTEVRDLLARHRVTPEQLDIEITERSVVEDTTVLDDAAQRLTRLGVGLSLDDFGTGFTSLRRLRRLPLSEVKIDRSYVSRVTQSPPDRAIVNAIYDLSQVLGLRIVAEGVEDEATVRILAKLDSVIGQGWYYGHPMAAPQLVDWLRERRDHNS